MSLQERIEASPTGRAVIAGLIAAFVLITVGYNLPGSQLRTDVVNAFSPTARALGLDQHWGMFAPDPRGESIGLVAQITYADGTQATWVPPAQGTVLAPYWTYQWWKWVEGIYFDSGSRYWYPTALWVARQHSARHPVSVTLVRRWKPSSAPGSTTRQSWHHYAFFTLQVDPGMLK